MRKIIKALCLFLCLLSIISVTVSAEKWENYQAKSPYYSYEYNSYDELTAAPDGYTADEVFYLQSLNIDMTDASLSDLYCDGENIYILDAGLSRVIILNKDKTLKEIITKESIINKKYKDSDMDFTGAQGIFVCDDKSILICDTERERVLIIKDKVLEGIISRPDTTVLSDSIKFDVKKAVKAGDNYYLAAESVISGTLVFNEKLEFVRFFGSNNVTVTAEVLLNAIQSTYMSDEQIAAKRKFSASKIASLDVDENGFVVVVSSDPELTVEGSAVRCLNYKGDDITESCEEDFGDREITEKNANTFSDVAVDSENFYVLLDLKYGRVFVYAENGVMISAFGGIGSETGLFKEPVAVDTIGNDIMVLDGELNNITFFTTTDYIGVKRELLKIIDGGDNKRIAELSKRLLKYNTNCRYAYYAMGFVEESKGNYGKAMQYYKQANYKDSYAQSYKLKRSQYVKSHFMLIVTVLLLIIAGIVAGLIYLSKGLAKKEGMVYAPLENKKGFPLYCLFHPADGFSQIKERDVLSPVWLIGILAVFVYINIMSFFTVGYIHNDNRAVDFNLLTTLAKTLGIIAIFVISNWAICTLMDGKGKPSQILYTVVYSLIPYVLALIINLILSRFLTADEAVMMSIVMVIGEIWSGLVMFVGLLTIHEYSVGKAVFSVFLTLVGMAVIVLLIVMFYTLMAQTISFVQSIAQEYSLRH